MWHEDLMSTIVCDMQVRDGCLDDMSQMSEAERRKYIHSEIRKMYFNKGERLFRFTYWMRICGSGIITPQKARCGFLPRSCTN